MGFNREIRKAKDVQLPGGLRYASLRSAVTMFSPNGFNGTFANLASAVGIGSREEPWSDKQLSQGADLLSQSRDHYIRHKDQWDTERRRQKTQGNRFAGADELEALNGDSWFDDVSMAVRRRFRWLKLEEWARYQELELAPFGPELAEDLQAVESVMPRSEIPPRGQQIAHYGPFPGLSEPANIVGIPNRIYSEPIPRSNYRTLTPTQRVMADCLYTRSNDGYVRQMHVRQIVSVEELWVIPYVVLALGDYVMPVVAEVFGGLHKLKHAQSWQRSSYKLFAEHNFDLIHLVRQRAISYWDCYYSNDYALKPNSSGLPQHPTLDVLDSIGVRNFGSSRYRIGPAT